MWLLLGFFSAASSRRPLLVPSGTTGACGLHSGPSSAATGVHGPLPCPSGGVAASTLRLVPGRSVATATGSRGPLLSPLHQSRVCLGHSWATRLLPQWAHMCRSQSLLVPLWQDCAGRSVTAAACSHRLVPGPFGAAAPGACCHSPTTRPVCRGKCQLGECLAV